MEETVSRLQNSKSILIATPTIETWDQLFAMLALYRFLSNSEKKVSLVVGSFKDSRMQKYLHDEKIPFQLKFKPLRYIVSIDYGDTKIESITYKRDDVNHKIVFYVSTANNDFDFDNIEYLTEGEEYDFVVAFGVSDRESLLTAIKYNGKKLPNKNFLFFNTSADESQLGNVSVSTGGYAYAVYKLLVDFYSGESKILSKDFLNIILMGVLTWFGIPMIDKSQKFASIVADISSQGGDLEQSKSMLFDFIPSVWRQIVFDPKTEWVSTTSDFQKKNLSVSIGVVRKARLKDLKVEELYLPPWLRFPIDPMCTNCLNILLLEWDINKIFGLVYCNGPEGKFNALDMVRPFNGRGDEYRAEFLADELQLKYVLSGIQAHLQEFRLKIDLRL